MSGPSSMVARSVVTTSKRRTGGRCSPTRAISEDEAITAKLNLLDQMIVEDIMLAKANELKIVLPESELDTAFNDGKKNISDDDFNKELSARNLTAADMREALRRDLIAPEGDRAGSDLEDHGHRPGHQRLLPGEQGAVQPRRGRVPHRADRRDGGRGTQA